MDKMPTWISVCVFLSTVNGKIRKMLTFIAKGVNGIFLVCACLGMFGIVSVVDQKNIFVLVHGDNAADDAVQNRLKLTVSLFQLEHRCVEVETHLIKSFRQFSDLIMRGDINLSAKIAI